MAIQYPDMLGEFFEARQRFERDGIQYVTYFEPNPIASGQSTTLLFGIQSVVDQPVELSLSLDVPSVPKKFQGFKFAEREVTRTIQPGDVCELKIPVQAADVPAGSHTFRCAVQAKSARRAQRVRPSRFEGRMPPTPIKDFVGLELAPTVGLDYRSKGEKRVTLKLGVEAGTGAVETDLTPAFTELWRVQDMDLQVQATKEFRDRRLYLISPLSPPVIFAAMLNESRQRFEDAGIRLALGEAIFLSKMLTRTVQGFISNEALQDGLFVPIFERLLASDVPFDSVTWLLMKFGYEHVINLAAALSFGMLENHLKQRIWPLSEQRAVRQFIVQQLRRRDALPIDFLYAPLVLGGVLVGRDVILDGEDIDESLLSMKKARDVRMPDLVQEDDQVVTILDNLLRSQGLDM